MKSLSIQLFIYLMLWSGSLKADEPQNPYTIFISKSIPSHSNNYKPSLSVEKTQKKIKWFDDNPSQEISSRIELGLLDNSNGWSYLWRKQTINGTHLGSAAQYNCLGFFCSWIDSSVLSKMNKSDRIGYEISMNQLSLGKKIFNSNFASFELKGGINILNVNLTIASLDQTYTTSGKGPLPLIGAKLIIKISDRLTLEKDLQNTFFKKNESQIKIKDETIDLSYDLNKFMKIAYGYENLEFRTDYVKSETIVKLRVPHKSSHIKLTFLY